MLRYFLAVFFIDRYFLIRVIEHILKITPPLLTSVLERREKIPAVSGFINMRFQYFVQTDERNSFARIHINVRDPYVMPVLNHHTIHFDDDLSQTERKECHVIFKLLA